MGGKASADQKVEVGVFDGESWANPGEGFPSVEGSCIKPFRASCTFGRGGIYFNILDGRGIWLRDGSSVHLIQSIFEIID